jgi:small subunit ribosomal protein S1
VFVGLEGGIDGLIHLSDLSWQQPGEEAIRNFKKGDEVEAVVLSVDPERERISLGLKQLDRDPFASFVAEHAKGSIVKGVVKEVDAKAAVIELADGIDGILRAADISRDRVEDAPTLLVGDASIASGARPKPEGPRAARGSSARCRSPTRRGSPRGPDPSLG